LLTMSERMDEATGNIKQAVGKATGNQKLEGEGKVEHDAAAARRDAQDAANQGATVNEPERRATEGLGRVSGSDEARDRPTADRMKGDAR